MNKFLSEPYRLFFPLGFLLGFWGVLLWLLFVFAGIPYPSVSHSYLMIGGFLTAFTSGFLMTAIPRFTGTFHAEMYEVIISFTALLVLFLLSSSSIPIKSLCLIVSHANLVLFFFRRYFKKKAALPLLFLFVPLSLFFSILGNGIVFFNAVWSWGSFEALMLGRTLAFSAMMLGLVLGIGSRLIPMFLGAGVPSHFKNHWVVLLIINFYASFFVQSYFNPQLGLLMRLIAVGVIALGVWRIYKKPLNPSKLSLGLWLSCWGLLLGTAGGFIMPSYLVHWMHLVYIAGFGLMTLMIGSRVVLSHGGFDVFKEVEHFHFTFILFSLFIAAAARVSLFYYGEWYNPILILSASFWLISLIFWWIRVGMKLL